MAIAPAAPGRLSITTGCPHFSVSLGPISRARMSEVPPGGNGTTMRIGLAGKLCAGAGCANAKTASAAAFNARARAGFMTVFSWSGRVGVFPAAMSLVKREAGVLDELCPAVLLLAQPFAGLRRAHRQRRRALRSELFPDVGQLDDAIYF